MQHCSVIFLNDKYKSIKLLYIGLGFTSQVKSTVQNTETWAIL